MKKTRRTNLRKKSKGLKSLRKKTMKHKYRRNGGMRSILGATSNIARVTARVTGDIASDILKDQIQKIPSGKDVLSVSKKHETIYKANNQRKVPEYYRRKYTNTDSDSENIHPNIQYSTSLSNTDSDSENINPNTKRQISEVLKSQVQSLKPKTPKDTNI